MKRGTKITVFVASMALTFGSLMAFAGPHRCGRSMKAHWNDHSTEAGCLKLSGREVPQN